MADVQMSESYRAASTLALAGGFLESYTFLLHGHVFANAQTGNIALCGMAVASRDWIAAGLPPYGRSASPSQLQC